MAGPSAAFINGTRRQMRMWLDYHLRRTARGAAHERDHGNARRRKGRVAGQLGPVAVLGGQNRIQLPPRLRKQTVADGSTSENPLDLVWLIAGALAAVFGLASLVLAVDAVRRRYPGIVTVFGVLVVAAGFVAIALMVLHWAAASTN